MPQLQLSRNRLSHYLSLITPDQAVGASGLVILFAASILSLLPTVGITPLAQWISGLGLNVLADFLFQQYQDLLSQPDRGELERLSMLAHKLTKDVQRQAELRHEIGVFLGNMNAFQIAMEIVKGNPAIHGWLLARIHQDIAQYRNDFDHIHVTLAEIKSLLQRLEPTLGSAGPFTAPLLPPQGIFGRETDLDTIREWLSLNTIHTDLPFIALLGMGGVGKTTLATALTYLPNITNIFPDGVLWTELGPKPDIRLRLEEWGRSLGIETSLLPDEEACSRRLRERLHNQRALLIVDDVWESSAGQLFKVGGPGCRTLFTTRELPIANDLATPSGVYHVHSISPEAAFDLLRALAPEVVKADEASAEQLCEKLEFLPLALTLAGRYLANEALTDRRRRTIVQRLLARADERLALPQFEKRLGIDSAQPSLRAILGLSVERLNRIDQERFAMLSLFGGEPLSWTMDAAMCVWDCSENEADATIARFLQRGLIEQRNGRYRMHALLADYAAVMLQEMGL